MKTNIANSWRAACVLVVPYLSACLEQKEMKPGSWVCSDDKEQVVVPAAASARTYRITVSSDSPDTTIRVQVRDASGKDKPEKAELRVSGEAVDVGVQVGESILIIDQDAESPDSKSPQGTCTPV